ncbi:MAG TPA: cyclic nucleotide-binding domain-containing protein [Terracidiphilus sp.]|nr:cyclic nucleotide-binding domain-containing protein [Terracidiphilus sp.]
MFPRLSTAEIALLRGCGSERSISKNEVLYREGEAHNAMFVVLEGCIELRVMHKVGEPELMHLGPGEFTGDVELLLGEPCLTSAEVKEPGRMLEIERKNLLRIAREYSSLNMVFLRSYLLRRANSVSCMTTDSLLVGSSRSAGTWRVKAFLDRNYVPYTYLDLDRDSALQWLLDQFAVRPEEIPLLVCKGRTVLRNPSNAMVANRLEVLSNTDNAAMWNIEIAVFAPSGK